MAAWLEASPMAERAHRPVARRPHLAHEIRDLHARAGDRPDPALMHQLVGHLRPWARLVAEGKG